MYAFLKMRCIENNRPCRKSMVKSKLFKICNSLTRTLTKTRTIRVQNDSEVKSLFAFAPSIKSSAPHPPRGPLLLAETSLALLLCSSDWRGINRDRPRDSLLCPSLLSGILPLIPRHCVILKLQSFTPPPSRRVAFCF